MHFELNREIKMPRKKVLMGNRELKCTKKFGFWKKKKKN